MTLVGPLMGGCPLSCRVEPVAREALPALEHLYRRGAWVPPDEDRAISPPLAGMTFGHPRHTPELALGAWLGDTLAGALFARPYPEHDGIAVVVALFTDPCRRRRGVAAALVGEVRRRAEALGLRRLLFPQVDERNREAVALAVSLRAEPDVRIVRLGRVLGPDGSPSPAGGGWTEPGTLAEIPQGWRLVTFAGDDAGDAARLVSSGALLSTFNAAFPEYPPTAADLNHLIESVQFLPAVSACLTRNDGEVGACLMATAHGRRGHVNLIATHPECRRQGLAKALLGHALRALQRDGFQAADAQVLDTNEASLATFRGRGFSIWSRSHHWGLELPPAQE